MIRAIISGMAITCLAFESPVAAAPEKTPEIQQWLNSRPMMMKGTRWRKCFTAPLSEAIDKIADPPGSPVLVEGLKAEYRIRPYFEFNGQTTDARFTCVQRPYVHAGTTYHIQDITYLIPNPRPDRPPPPPNGRINAVRICALKYVLADKNAQTKAVFEGQEAMFGGRGCYAKWTGDLFLVPYDAPWPR